MPKLSEYNQNALALRFNDLITEASPNVVVDVLKKNGFADQFQYGVNALQAEKILNATYLGNRDLYVKMVGEMLPKIDTSRIDPSVREKFQNLAAENNPNPNAKSEWLSGLLDMLTPKTVTEGGETTTEETSTGAYVAYAIIVLAIIGITVYLLKTVK